MFSACSDHVISGEAPSTLIPTAKPSYRIKPIVRSGWLAANMALIAHPSEKPSRAARSEPTASITARMSSMRSSNVGASPTGSESPLPRLSNMISREKPASRSRKLVSVGFIH